MSKLWLVRFIAVGAPMAHDCWFKSEAAAKAAYDEAVAKRSGAKKEAPFVWHDIADDLGIRQNLNLIGTTIILSDTMASAAMERIVGMANSAAKTEAEKTARSWLATARPAGSS